MNNQGTPSANSSPASKLQAKHQPKPDLSWWDLLPLVQEPQHAAAIHWTPQGIIAAHPSKPIILLYPQPPSTSERKIFPSDRRITETEAFGPASVLSVSGSGEYVFAYFPFANGANSGAWCIWVNMILKEFGTAEQGEAIVACWWLGDPRQRITDENGKSLRLPPLGPRIAFHTPACLLLSENFTLQLVYEPIAGHRPEGSFQKIAANALRKTLHALPWRSAGLDPYTGHLCLDASLGVAYSDSSIIIAMQTALLPPPCLPLSESQAMGLAIPATPFLPHADTDDWEYTGAESTIRLCEVMVTCSERGWDMQTSPLTPIPLSTSGQLTHLHFIPKVPHGDDNMTIDVVYQIDRYLLVGISDIDSYSTLPDTSLSVYSLAKRGNDPRATHEWETQKVSDRKFERRTITAISTVSPVSQAQLGILACFARTSTLENQDPGDDVRTLQIPSLLDDERYSAVALRGPDIPSRLSISPQGTQMTVQALSNPKHLGFHPYPSRNHVPQATAMRDAILNALLSSQDIYNVARFITHGDRESKLDIIDSVWDVLDSEHGGGGPTRWSVEYLRALLMVDRMTIDDGNKDLIEKRTKATISLLSLLTARSAFIDSHSKDIDGPYDPDCIWPLFNICNWIVELTEAVLSAASDYQNAMAEDSQPSNVDPILFLLLHRPLLGTWIDSLTGATQFLAHVTVPPGTNSDNKTLVTKAVTDVMEQSPVNFPTFLEALKGLDKETPIPPSDWRKGYRTLQVPENLSKPLTDAISRLITPEIVSLLPLQIRLAGLSINGSERVHEERDIITKRPLVDTEWQTLRGKTTCRRCGGKTTVGAVNAPSMQRWRLWEMGFDRCVCGGQWK